MNQNSSNCYILCKNSTLSTIMYISFPGMKLVATTYAQWKQITHRDTYSLTSVSDSYPSHWCRNHESTDTNGMTYNHCSFRVYRSFKQVFKRVLQVTSVNPSLRDECKLYKLLCCAIHYYSLILSCHTKWCVRVLL